MRVLWVSIAVLLIDQASKAAVLQLMHRGESIPILGDWLRFTFTENPGMAFGIVLLPREATAIFSVIVTVLVLWYLYSVRSGYPPYLFSLALVLGGAVGNIIDRLFYGLILGYGDLFMGKVVDFIHVDVWRGYLPEALPLVGGSYLPLFPIWNVADMAIVVGVVGILVFQRRFHRRAFEDPARDRQRLRALERERDEARRQAAEADAKADARANAESPGIASPPKAATQASPHTPPPQAATAENPAVENPAPEPEDAPKEASAEDAPTEDPPEDDAGESLESADGEDRSRYAPPSPS